MVALAVKEGVVKPTIENEITQNFGNETLVRILWNGLSNKDFTTFIDEYGLQEHENLVRMMVETAFQFGSNIQRIQTGRTFTVLAQPKNDSLERYDDVLTLMTHLKMLGWIALWTENTVVLRPPATSNPDNATKLLETLERDLGQFAHLFTFGVGGSSYSNQDDVTGNETFALVTHTPEELKLNGNESFREVGLHTDIIAARRQHGLVIDQEKRVQQCLFELFSYDQFSQLFSESQIAFLKSQFIEQDLHILHHKVTTYLSSPNTVTQAFLEFRMNSLYHAVKPLDLRRFWDNYINEMLFLKPIKVNFLGFRQFELQASCIAADGSPHYFAKGTGFKHMDRDGLLATCIGNGECVASFDQRNNVRSPSIAARRINYGLSEDTFSMVKEVGRYGVTMIEIDTNNSTRARIGRSAEQNYRDVALSLSIFQSIRYYLTQYLRRVTNDQTIVLDHATIGESMTLIIPTYYFILDDNLYEIVSNIYRIANSIYHEATGLSYHGVGERLPSDTKLFVYNHYLQVIDHSPDRSQELHKNAVKKAKRNGFQWVYHPNRDGEHQLEVGA